MRIDPCRNSFDYFLSKGYLEHIYCGSKEARSVFISSQFHTFDTHHTNQIPSQSINRDHHTRSQINNHHTLSLALRRKCARNCFTPLFTLRFQDDCSPFGQQIRLPIQQLFPELAFKTTIKIRRGKSPRHAIAHKGLSTTLLIPSTLQKRYI